MPPPARETLAGQVYNDLRNLARREGRSTDQIMIEYVLERFLYRMSRQSTEDSCFILKGGLLLAQFGARRATRDMDILGRLISHDRAEITSRVTGIARLAENDGVAFDPSALKTAPIREDSQGGGLRLTMPAAINRAQIKVQLDVSIGDPVFPDPQVIAYPQKLSADSFPVLGYPLASVVAEKLCTAIALGDLNTRDLPQRRQASYLAWRRRQGHEMTRYPESFADVVALVQAFADPLIAGEAAGQCWRPLSGWARQLPRK
ncbi:MAG: nucleotidyl transferase AbiEii/AbiGii toxin family protein [Streptosporangiaceae bacterium]|jgi:hypothetical protein